MSDESHFPVWLSLGLRALALLGAGAIVGVAFNQLRPQTFAFRTWEPPTTCTNVAEEDVQALPPVEMMVPEQVAALCSADGVVIADVRDTQRYAAGHVAQALHLPCTASADTAKRAVGMLAGSKTLVVYGEATDDAARVADSLREKAARPDLRIVVMSGGFEAWNEAGLACSSGACADCGAKL